MISNFIQYLVKIVTDRNLFSIGESYVAWIIKYNFLLSIFFLAQLKLYWSMCTCSIKAPYENLLNWLVKMSSFKETSSPVSSLGISYFLMKRLLSVVTEIFEYWKFNSYLWLGHFLNTFKILWNVKQTMQHLTSFYFRGLKIIKSKYSLNNFILEIHYWHNGVLEKMENVHYQLSFCFAFFVHRDSFDKDISFKYIMYIECI